MFSVNTIQAAILGLALVLGSILMAYKITRAGSGKTVGDYVLFTTVSGGKRDEDERRRCSIWLNCPAHSISSAPFTQFCSARSLTWKICWHYLERSRRFVTYILRL